MASYLHVNILGDASQAEVPDGATAKVMNEQPRIEALRVLRRHLAMSKSSTGVLPGGSEGTDIEDWPARPIGLTEHVHEPLAARGA